ncbi:MAG: hypothetical protein FWD61_05935, partial [Phycisphaerales bacterium]|nr:hypothetical protein [Phycisphaerales bacterium]
MTNDESNPNVRITNDQNVRSAPALRGGFGHSLIRHVALAFVLAVGCRTAWGEVGGLKVTWGEADHASGIYYVKQTASLNVMVENATDGEMVLDGEVAFGPVSGVGKEFKAVSVTPIKATVVGANQRAKIPLKVEFAAAGVYELRWTSGEKITMAVEHAAGIQLQAIFAPRVGEEAETAGGGRWVTNLSRQAGLIAGYLQDYAQQTSVRRFVLDERFGFDPKMQIGLGMGASLGLSVKQLDGLFVDVGKAKAGLVLRVVVSVGEKPEATLPRSQKSEGADHQSRDRQGATGAVPPPPPLPHGRSLTVAALNVEEVRVAAFRQYLAEGMKRAHGAVKGIVVVPETAERGGGGRMRRQPRGGSGRFSLGGRGGGKRRDRGMGGRGQGV